MRRWNRCGWAGCPQPLSGRADVAVTYDSSTMERRNRETAEAQQTTDHAMPTGSGVQELPHTDDTSGRKSPLPWTLSDRSFIGLLCCSKPRTGLRNTRPVWESVQSEQEQCRWSEDRSRVADTRRHVDDFFARGIPSAIVQDSMPILDVTTYEIHSCLTRPMVANDSEQVCRGCRK